MGTSRSSPGAPPNVPLVPPWVPPHIPPTDKDAAPPDPAAPQQTPPPSASPPAPMPLAPAGRFGPARASLGRFAGSGTRREMQRGLGHYIHKGLGGSQRGAQRLGSVARTAGALHNALAPAAGGQGATVTAPLDPAVLRGRSADEIMDAVVEAVRPVDGTQDAEADRNAIKDALSQLLDQFPNADLLNLDETQRAFAVERFVAVDIFNRVCLDIAKAVKDKAPTAAVALTRLREIKNYIRETVSAIFRRIQTTNTALTARRVAAIVNQTIQETFQVFEGFL
jgi:hypothetical protein